MEHKYSFGHLDLQFLQNQEKTCDGSAGALVAGFSTATSPLIQVARAARERL